MVVTILAAVLFQPTRRRGRPPSLPKRRGRPVQVLLGVYDCIVIDEVQDLGTTQ